MVTENLPKKPGQDQFDIARIHFAIDEALDILMRKGTREEDFDLKAELALRTIREELEKLKRSRHSHRQE